MGYRRYRSPSRRRRRRRAGVFLMALGLGLLVCFFLLDAGLRPVIQSYGANRAKIYAADIVNRAVADVLCQEPTAYDSLVRQVTLSDGTIAAVETDAVAIDQLKTSVIQRVKGLSQEDPGELKIPVGTLTGVSFLLGRGPDVSIKMQFSPYIYSNITSEFQSAGINQTLHQMMLQVTGEVYILMPGADSTVQVDADFCLAETILVGEVPDAYTHVTGGELANNIADYGAGSQ